MSVGNNYINKIYRLKKKLFGNKTHKEKSKVEAENVNKRKAFYAQFISDGDLCFDVGANVGNRTEILLSIGAKVVAVEPQESCYKILQDKFGDKIEIVTNGLAANEGAKNFHISNASTISSFSEEWISSVKQDRFKEYNWDKVVSIEMTTLDKLIEKYGVPTFIKIDVEGYELEVLKGLSYPIKYISFEYTVPEQTNKILECVQFIKQNKADVEWNFSSGESMQFSFNQWQTISEIDAYINTKEFISTAFGDIYVRLKD